MNENRTGSRRERMRNLVPRCIRAEFGERVDRWIDDLTNRHGDQDRADEPPADRAGGSSSMWTLSRR